jgi:hypothetical protein
MFQVREWPLDLIICLLDVLKNNFDEVDEAIFHGVERPCKLVLIFLGIKKAILKMSLK